MMDRSVADSSLHSFIQVPQFDPVSVSTRLAFKGFFSLMLFYIVGVLGIGAIWALLFGIDLRAGMDMHNPAMVIAHIASLYIGVLTALPLLITIGGLLILFGGCLHGWLVGHLLRRMMTKPLVPWQAILLGFGISVLFLGGRLLIAHRLFGEALAAFLSSTSSIEFLLGLVFWYAPHALLFGGVWWVVYQVNLAIASPLSSPSSFK